MSRIAVIGSGYVGLTAGACFAELGHYVLCADIDEEKVERLSRGDIPILEAGLPELVREGMAARRLKFVVGAAAAAASCEFVYLCVPTPQAPDGSADLTYLRDAARAIGPVLAPESVVVNKSTVPIGSTRVVEEVLGRDDVAVVSNPEFLREGSAVRDFLHPDRIVIGCDDQAAAARVGELYRGVQAPVIVTDPASAEMIKYASNTFLAAKLSFVNAVANVCEAVGADVRDVLLGMGYDHRIGFEFLRPGPGWGGSCFLGDDTLLLRRGDDIGLRSFADLSDEVDRVGADGWEALAWRPGSPTPEFLPVTVFTRRPYAGDVVEVRTKMGRRVTVTADHPFFVGDGVEPTPRRVLAADLATTDWLPVAQGFPLVVDGPTTVPVTDALPLAGIDARSVMVWLSESQKAEVELRREALRPLRRHEIRRTGVARLNELRELGVAERSGRLGTVNNGATLPAEIPLDEDFWRMVGLYLAEGWITRDGRRSWVCWSFHPTDEGELVEWLAGYWRALGVKTTVRRAATGMHVSISSRLLAAVLSDRLGLGANCYEKRLPDAIWRAAPRHKLALLRGLWDGDGSWSYVAGGPSVILEYETVSRHLADGMLRLLGDLGVTARLKTGRTAKSTVATYWLAVSGADQIDELLGLFPLDEQWEIADSQFEQAKRIKPTGFRRLSKNASWVRITNLERRHHEGPVFSLKVPDAGTVVTSNGLVVGQCFPKDVNALIRIAADAGYDFRLLQGVLDVNREQFESVAAKVQTMAGGSLEGLVIAAWGLTFKARTDDLRDSPAVEVIERLRAKGAVVKAFDPAVSHPLDGIDVCADPYAACDGAATLVVLTEWDEFRRLDFVKVASLLTEPRVVDARNLLDPAALRRLGFAYVGVGR